MTILKFPDLKVVKRVTHDRPETYGKKIKQYLAALILDNIVKNDSFKLLMKNYIIQTGDKLQKGIF
jgi:hypothetical protein